jgi:hypothetical protein
MMHLLTAETDLFKEEASALFILRRIDEKH